jgi:hypothetical protein
VLNSGGDGLPPGVGEIAPGRDSQARQSSGATCCVRALNAHTGGTREICGGCVRGCPRAERTPPEGVLSSRAERTPPEGVLSPRARRTLLEGRVEPSSEADPARGGVKVSSGADPAQGSVYPSSEANLTRGASAAWYRRAAGATGVTVMLCTRFRCAS